MIVSFKRIRTYLPLPNGQPANTSAQALEAACPCLKEVLALLHASDPIGRVGQYAAVYGASVAAGGSLPLPGSNPVGAEINAMESACAVSFSTYAAASVPLEAIQAFVERLAELHPWEHPVIEINDIALWMPTSPSGMK
jgi:hypothetical protein